MEIGVGKKIKACAWRRWGVVPFRQNLDDIYRKSG